MTTRKPPAQKAATAKVVPIKAAAKKAAPRKRAPRKPRPTEVETFDAAHEAHQLRLTGMPWREVARLTGYATEDSVQLAVQAYLQRAVLERSKEQRAAALATELARLDALTLAYWQKAIGGDLDAAKYVLAVSAQRAKYEGLEVKEETATTSQTIVITGNTDEYIGALKRLTLPPPEHPVIES